MSRELPFIVLCLEEYKNQKHLSGKEVIEIFNKYLKVDEDDVKIKRVGGFGSTTKL